MVLKVLKQNPTQHWCIEPPLWPPQNRIVPKPHSTPLGSQNRIVPPGGTMVLCIETHALVLTDGLTKENTVAGYQFDSAEWEVELGLYEGQFMPYVTGKSEIIDL